MEKAKKPDRGTNRKTWRKGAVARSKVLKAGGWSQERIDRYIDLLHDNKQFVGQRLNRPVPIDPIVVLPSLHPGLRLFSVSDESVKKDGIKCLEFIEDGINSRWVEWTRVALVDMIMGLVILDGESNPEKLNRRADAAIKTMYSLLAFRGGLLDDIDSDPDRIQDADGKVVFIGKDRTNEDGSELRTGAIVPHRLESPMCRRMAFAYDPEAPCPIMDEKCMPVWTQGDKEYEDYLFRMAGLALLPHNKEHLVLYSRGLGTNGKSTWSETLMKMMGDYATTCPVEAVLANRHDGELRNHLPEMVGRRFVFMSDMDNESELKAGKLKALSGDEQTSTRRNYQDPRTASITFTMFFSGNVNPILNDSKKAWMRRLRILPWRAKIVDRPDAEEVKSGKALAANSNLKAELQAEWAGIFNRMIAGLRSFYDHGERIPDVVETAITKYFAASGTHTQMFIDDVLMESDDESHVVSGDTLWQHFLWWCVDNNLTGLKFDSENVGSPIEPRSMKPEQFFQELVKFTGSMEKEKHGDWMLHGYLIHEAYESRSRQQHEKSRPSVKDYALEEDRLQHERRDDAAEAKAEDDIPW